MLFDSYVDDTITYLKAVSEMLDNQDNIEEVYRITIAALHDLRSRMEPHDFLQAIAPLPILLKGAAVDGWSMADDNTTITKGSTLLETIREYNFKPAVGGLW